MPTLLLRVDATWSLPGLGLLALPAGPTPHLTKHSLHTSLAVEAVLPGGVRIPATATVEEVTLTAADFPVRGLLLDFGMAIELVPGAEIWLSQA